MSSSKSHMSLAVLAIFKDECHTMDEWLRHHRAQGVELFVLIDNDSIERCDHIFARHQPAVRLLRWPWRPTAQTSGQNQMRAYRHALEAVPELARGWVLISDLDEFAFARTGTLRDELAAVPRSISQICMPTLRFGSSNLTRQPACITRSNVKREWHSNRSPHPILGKCVTRGDAFNASGAEVHRTIVHGDSHHNRSDNCLCADLRTNCRRGPHAAAPCYLNEHSMVNQRLLLFHYQVQSLEHISVVVRRGDADLVNARRNWQRREQTLNVIHDETLAARSVCEPAIASADADALDAQEAQRPNSSGLKLRPAFMPRPHDVPKCASLTDLTRRRPPHNMCASLNDQADACKASRVGYTFCSMHDAGRCQRSVFYCN